MVQKKLSIRIDGQLITVREGQTVLQAAQANGKYIPSLCALEGMTPVGGCRLCLVEVAGVDRIFPACNHTRAGWDVGDHQLAPDSLLLSTTFDRAVAD